MADVHIAPPHVADARKKEHGNQTVCLARAIGNLPAGERNLLFETGYDIPLSEMAASRGVTPGEILRLTAHLLRELGLSSSPSHFDRQLIREALKQRESPAHVIAAALKELPGGRLTFARYVARGLDHAALADKLTLKPSTASSERGRLYSQLGMLDIAYQKRVPLLEKALEICDAGVSVREPSVEEIAARIETLPPKKRQVIAMRISGCDDVAIAAEFGSTTHQVSNWIYLTHRKLGLCRALGNNRCAALLKAGYHWYLEQLEARKP